MNLEHVVDLEKRHLLQTYTRQPAMLVSGSGCYVTDSEGRRYLDMVSGIGVNALGHAHPALVAAMNDQAAKMLRDAHEDDVAAVSVSQ